MLRIPTRGGGHACAVGSLHQQGLRDHPLLVVGTAGEDRAARTMFSRGGTAGMVITLR